MTLTDFGDKSAHDVGMDIVARLNARWSVRLETILFDESLDFEDKRKRLIAAMVEPALEEFDRRLSDLGEGPDGIDNADLLARALSGNDVAFETNFTVTPHNFAIIRDYKGDDVKNYVFNLSNRFEQMSKATTPGELAAEIITGGLVTVGVSLAWNFVQFRREGKVLLEALKLAVKGLGTKTVVTIILIALAALILYFTMSAPKRILGIVFNDTDSNLVVKNWRIGAQGGDHVDSDLYMTHGKVVSFPVVHENSNLDSPEVQVHARMVDEDPEDTQIFGGIYFCDRNFGFRGTEGLFIFSGLPDRWSLSHMFAVPYTHDNGTFMEITNYTHLTKDSYYRTLYDQRKVRIDNSAHGYRYTSCVNDARGGVVGLIATIAKE